MFDVTDKNSFNTAKKWIKRIREFYKNIQVVLIGNKTDLIDQRKMWPFKINRIKDDDEVVYFESSNIDRNNSTKPINYLIKTSIIKEIYG